MAVGRPARETQGLGGLPLAKPREEAKLHEISADRIILFEPSHRIVKSDEILIRSFVSDNIKIEVHTTTAAASLEATPITGLIDHDPAHGLGGRGKEMASPAPVLGILAIRDPKVCLMDERCRLKSLVRLLTRQP